MPDAPKPKELTLIEPSMLYKNGWNQIDYGDGVGNTFFRGEWCKVKYYRSSDNWIFYCTNPDRKCKAYVNYIEEINILFLVLEEGEFNMAY